MGTLAARAHAHLAEAGFGTDARIGRATPVDGKAGARALIRFDVDRGAGEGAATLFGKVYADPAAAHRVFDTMRVVWDLFATGDPRATAPRPVALVPDVAMVLYHAAPGEPLGSLLDTAEGRSALELAGVWLRRLHSARLGFERRFALDQELSNLAEWCEVVAVACPCLAGVARDLCAQVRSTGAAVHLEADTPIHKDFHPGHVIVNGSVSVVDFDEARLGDPVFDLAHFCTYLHLLALRADLPVERLERSFLAAYADGPPDTDPRFGFFRAYTAIKIAKQLCTQRGPRPRPVGDDMEQQAAAVLAEGSARLEAAR